MIVICVIVGVVLQDPVEAGTVRRETCDKTGHSHHPGQSSQGTRSTPLPLPSALLFLNAVVCI